MTRSAVFANSPADENNEINLTPMLDVVFIMLIFFLVVASFVRESGLDVNRSEPSVPPATEAGNILVSIADDNGIWIDGRLIDPRAVRPNIERLKGENPDATLIIHAERHSANKTLVRVMDASRQAGIYSISLAAGDVNLTGR